MRRVRRAVAYRRYAYGDRVLVGSEVDPVEVRNAFRGLQRIAPRADGLVVGHEVGQYDGKSSVVGFQLCGVERDEPVGTSGVDASVFCFAERRIVELIVQQSVVGGENVIAQGFGIETYEAFVRRDPENTLRILFDPIAGVERQPALVPDERVGFGIIRAGKFNVCLEYHIKNCAGPCIGLQSQEEYLKNIDEIKEILKGNTQDISRMLLERMQTLAGEMKFEEAQKVKEKYLLIESYRSKSEVVSSVLHNIDVFSIEEDESNSAFINYLHITNGAINQAFTFEYKKKLNESKEELLTLGIIEMRERYKSQSREIIVPFELDLELNNIVFTVPQRGDKKKLLDLSVLNVKQYKADRLKQTEKLNPEQRSMRLMKEIQQELHLERPPLQIECFDNSNIQGSDAVAACVVFKKAKPSKKDYRKYNIKTVVGPDDYASMKEVVRRRYQRAIEENSPLPDLIITDGGKGQMEVVREVVEDELNLAIPIAGLAKDNRHRTSELLFGFPPQTIGIKQQSPLFRLLTQIQDEVHRFAISFHRDKRSKRQVASALDTIKGIGEKTKTALLKEFKSVKRIKEASFEEIVAIIGEAKAKTVKEGLNNESSKNE